MWGYTGLLLMVSVEEGLGLGVPGTNSDLA